MIDFENSQNVGKTMANGPTFITFKPPPAMTSTKSLPATTTTTLTTTNNKLGQQSTTTKGHNGGIVHLGTRIISDDVPARNYDGLKSESVVSLSNVSTFPNKRSAPIIQKNDSNSTVNKNHLTNGYNKTNDFEDLKVDDVSNRSHATHPTQPSAGLPKNKKYHAPPPPSKGPQKLQIEAFERGKLPTIPKKDNQFQPDYVPPSTPLIDNFPPGSNDKSPQQHQIGSPSDVRRSNFQIGLPTILPVSYKTGIKPPTPMEDDTFTLDPILKAPDEFSVEQIKTNVVQKPPHQNNPWKENSKISNSLIRPFKLNPTETVRPSNFKETESQGGVRNIDLIPGNNLHEDPIKHDTGRTTSINKEITSNGDQNIPSSHDEVGLKRFSGVHDLSKIGTENIDTKTLNNNNITTITTVTKNSRFATKPRLEIPPNDFIKNKHFRTHLEGIIAKSSPMKTIPPRKNSRDRLQEGQVRKYKFLVEGIDVPKGTFTENQSDSEEKDLENSSSNPKKEMRGFSYLMDKEQAKQITLKAAEVTARRPHEFVESFNIEREIISNSKDDIDILRQARANLHAQITELKRKSKDSPDIKEGTTKNRDDVDAGPNKTGMNRHEKNEIKNENNSKVDLEVTKDIWHDINTDKHNIPHDTSRIFLRPHGEDMEQLKKLKEERSRSLSRSNQYHKFMELEETIETPNPNYQDLSSDSNPISNVETNKGRRYRQSKNGYSSSVMTLKQAKLKSISKKKANAPPAPNQTPSSHAHDLSGGQVNANLLIHAGESLPVKASAEQALREPHHTPNIQPLRVSDDETSVHSLESVFARSYKQRRYRHKKRINSKLDSKQKQLFDSSEYSDNDSIIWYRNIRHNLKSNNTDPIKLKNFDSEPEIIDSRRYVVSRNTDNQKYLPSNAIQIRQTDRIVKGLISVPPLPSKKSNLIKGELTFSERPKTELPKKVNNTPSKGVSIYGPRVHYKIFDDRQVSNTKTSTLPPNVPRSFNNNDNNVNYIVPLNDIRNEHSRKGYKIKKNFMNSLARSMPALDSTIIDPELKKVNQRNGQYRVQMKLNAFNTGRFSSLSGNILENNYRESANNGRNVFNNITERESRNILSRNYATPVNLPPSYINPPQNYPINSTSVQVIPNENIHKSRINDLIDDDWDSYAIKSITPTIPAKIPQPSKIEFDLELLNTGYTKLNTYSVEQSKATNQHNDISSRKVNRIPQDSMLLMQDQIQSHTYSDDIPNVIRGSILIRNSLDKNTSRRYLDAVDRNGLNGKQDNNLFHGRYFQNRENPLYASDLETIEYGKQVRRMINERKSEKLPDIAMEWDETDGQKRNVPIKKEWYYDHIWNSRSSPAMQNKGGAWKLKSRMEDKRGTRRKNISNNSGQHVRQSIDVKREEEELIGPLQGEDVQRVEENLNVDAISEKVELSLSDGVITIEVRVRCERLVPIRGTKDMFRKSAVVVTRKIEIDMAVTPERKAMYDAAVAISKKHSPSDPNDDYLRLSTKDTFELYCKLMEIADEAGDSQEGLLFGSLHIDKELEEEARVPFGATSPEVLITEDDLLSPKASSAYHKHRTRHS